MNNNKKSNKSFVNLITKEEYEILDDQNQFEIDNKIRLCFENKYFVDDYIEHDEYLKKPEYYDNRDREGGYYLKSYPLNPQLLDQIYQVYLFERKNCFGAEVEIDNIKIKLLNTLDEKAKRKILEKEHSKFSKKMSNLELVKEYFSSYNNLDFESEEFIKFFKAHFDDGTSEVILGENEFEDNIINNADWPIYVEFITEGFNMNFNEFWVFRESDKIYEYSKVLKFLKDYNEKLNNKKRKTNSLEKNKKENNDNDATKVFREGVFEIYEAEQWFKNTLKKLGAVDANNNPNKGKFQPVCNAIWKNDSCRKSILKYNLRLKEFISFLNEKDTYNAQIPQLNKLSSELNHVIKIEEEVKRYKLPNNSE